MAISFDQRVLDIDIKVAGTSLSGPPTAEIAVSKLAVAYCTAEMVGTGSGEKTEHTVSDDKSNTWTRVGENGYDGSYDVTTSLWYSVLDTAITTGDDIILTTSGSVIPKCMIVYVFSIDEASVEVETYGVGGAYGTAGSASVSSLDSGTSYLLAMSYGYRRTSESSGTQDTDYTGEYVEGTIGDAAGSNATVVVGYRLASGLTEDTNDRTFSDSVDWAGVLGVLKEVAGAVTYSIEITSTF